MRHGCRSITQLEIMPRPPDERAADNPWPEWPKVYNMDYGQEEAKEVFGSDPRQYLTATKKFLGDEDGNLRALLVHDIEWKEENGRFLPLKSVVPREKFLPSWLFWPWVSLGLKTSLPRNSAWGRDTRSNVEAEYGKFSTNIEGVFAAGDMRRGQSLIVWAINEGRAAARECDRFLMGETSLP